MLKYQIFDIATVFPIAIREVKKWWELKDQQILSTSGSASDISRTLTAKERRRIGQKARPKEWKTRRENECRFIVAVLVFVQTI